MNDLGTVQHKVSCVFETAVLDEQSSKRENQSYKVVATNTVKQRAVDSDIQNAYATEKLDGTCVYIAQFDGKPWLWARFDRKPIKPAERKFKKFQQQRQKCSGDGSILSKYKWDLAKDFKETPANWIPASGVELVDGSPVPDDIGHTPGWVPICPSQRQYCWHLSAVDLCNGLALVLREDEFSDSLQIISTPLSELEGHTAELIGTNINGNPYSIGTKKFPIHMLVVHGSLKIRNPPEINSTSMKNWFTNEGQVEGIVWHCSNKSLFKLHRNHVGLQWPGREPALSQRSVEILVDTTQYELDKDKGLFELLNSCRGHNCDSLKDLVTVLADDKSESPQTEKVNQEEDTDSHVNNEVNS